MYCVVCILYCVLKAEGDVSGMSGESPGILAARLWSRWGNMIVLVALEPNLSTTDFTYSNNNMIFPKCFGYILTFPILIHRRVIAKETMSIYARFLL